MTWRSDSRAGLAHSKNSSKKSTPPSAWAHAPGWGAPRRKAPNNPATPPAGCGATHGTSEVWRRRARNEGHPLARLVLPQPGGPDISTGRRCLAAMASQDLAWPSPSMSSQPWSSLAEGGSSNLSQEGVEFTNSRRFEISQRHSSPWRSERNLSPPGAWTRRSDVRRGDGVKLGQTRSRTKGWTVKPSRQGQGSCVGRALEVAGRQTTSEGQQCCGKGQVKVRHIFFRAGRVHVKGERLGRRTKSDMGQSGSESCHAFLGRTRRADQRCAPRRHVPREPPQRPTGRGASWRRNPKFESAWKAQPWVNACSMASIQLWMHRMCTSWMRSA